jgi:hypothetical protein
MYKVVSIGSKNILAHSFLISHLHLIGKIGNMSKAGKASKSEDLKGQLVSDEESAVLTALEEIAQSGTAQMIEPLIQLYGSTRYDSIKKQVAELLNTLKISGAQAPMLAAIANPANKSIRKDIIGFMWNSGMQPVDDLAQFTKIAIEGTYEEALECITLLDSIMDPVQEEVLIECIILLKQHLNGASKSDKTTLLVQYLGALESMRIED